MGLIKSIKVNAKKWNHTKWYTIDEEKYKNILLAKNFHKDSTKTVIKKDIKNKSTDHIIEVDLQIESQTISTTNCSTNRFVEHRQIIITKNNYTNKSSYSEKEIDLEKLVDDLVDKKVEEKLFKLSKGQGTENSQNKAINKKTCNPIKSKIKVKEPKNVTTLEQISEIKEAGEHDETLVNNMVELWNKVFEHSVKPIKAYVNQKNQEILLEIFHKYFDADLDKWRDYGIQVNSSKFLMGEKITKNNFKATFSWLIKKETIEKISNGEYGVGDRELDMDNISKNMEEKKEEMVNKLDKKVSEYMKLNIDETKERREFEEYVQKHKEEGEEDRYGILRVTKHISHYNLFKTNEYAVLRESLYESYIMKKYLGITKIDARAKLREKIKLLTEKEGHLGTLEKLKAKEQQIECLEISVIRQAKYPTYAKTYCIAKL
jgi:hypothetical protein